ncbi:MAG TPA: rod shape-determining protein MreD [Gammaproteobacteria bacterium]|jgi:rod shape-determining protein MreD|nr:rod shape-determining protein MreD [Gammaproteobacteria bacterium]
MYSWFIILVSFFIAMILVLLPMPDWAVWYRPAWVLLILIYWAMVLPQYVNVGVAWFIGIFVDLLTGTLLGEHALAYIVVIYFVNRMAIRLNMSPLLQQGVSILFFVLLYQFILYCIQGFIGELPTSHFYWISSVTSMLLWPWLVVLMRDCRRWFKVAT